MISPILSITGRVILPLLLLFSVFVLLRGHYEPGGGFIGGLVTSSAFSLYVLSSGVERAKSLLRINPITLMVVGLSITVASGLFAVATQQVYLKGMWLEPKLPILGKVGTPLLFDLGVYITVVGVCLTIIFCLAEE